jgi:hypothetical protein
MIVFLNCQWNNSFSLCNTLMGQFEIKSSIL